MGGAVARPKYMGEMLNGQRHGQGRMVWSDGRKYDGAFVKGAREGFGTLELANGDRYEGEWQYDQMHGKGKYTSADGQYNGFWADGLREGKGKLTLESGTVYEGSFSRHQYHGAGHLKLKDGTYYDGEFFRGQMHGSGFRTFPEGSIYEGMFSQGNCHGKGRWFSSSAGWLFEGIFSHGNPVDGEMIHANGQVLHHIYSAPGANTKGFLEHVDPTSKRHIGTYGKGWDGHRDFTGKMIWKWADGREFRGEFKGGAPTRGRLYERHDKAWYDVEYHEGFCISDDRLKPNVKKLAQEEVNKDLLFSKNLERIQGKLRMEEEAYEQMLKVIEQELESRVLTETKLWVPPPPTPPPVEHWEGFERIASAAHVWIELRLGIEFHSIGQAETPVRAEFMSEVIFDLVNATGTHERLFRIEKLAEGSVILNVAILPDPNFEFMERTPAELAVFLLEQSKKPLSKFMRGKRTKKLLSIDLPEYVYEVLRQEEEEVRRRNAPTFLDGKTEIEAQPPPPARWSPTLENLSWQPNASGIGFHVGRLDLRAAVAYKAQVEAVHKFNMEQLAKIPPPQPKPPTPEPDYLSNMELVEQIREFVAFLYSGATLKSQMSEEERYPTTHPNTAMTDRNLRASTCWRSTAGKSVNVQGVTRERRDQRRAAQGLLELLGGNPNGSIDSNGGWNVEPFYHKKLAQATSTAELLWGHGGIKALVFVLRGAYPDKEFTEELSGARNDKEREGIIKASIGKGHVDIRELASECILRACILNPANRMRLRMKIGPNRPEGDGVLALVDLLRRGPDGCRERAAAALAVICKDDAQSKEDVAMEGGVQALLELFCEACPAALKEMEIHRLFELSEGRKLRASSAANEQIRVSLMDEAQSESDILADMRRVLQHRRVRLKEVGIEALNAITTDCFDACESLLIAGGLEVMKLTIVQRLQEGALTREGSVEIESAVGIIENVCRSFFQPGVLKETSSIAPGTTSGAAAAASARGASKTIISNSLLELLHNQIEKCNLVGLMCQEVLISSVSVGTQARAVGSMWAMVDGRSEYTARILNLNGMSLISQLLSYGSTGDQNEMEARELAVGLLSSMLQGNEHCANVCKKHGAVARLMQLMNLGDDGLGAFSTQELAAKALFEALDNSEDCRSEARRSGIRQLIKSIMDSPLLYSPDDLERQQAQSSQVWARKLLNAVNRPPHRGERGKLKVDDSWGVAPATKVQCNFRMHFSRKKLAQLRAMPITLRHSLLRIENAITNISGFQEYCALETEEGDGGHLGERALTMDVHEYVEFLRHLDILHVHADDKHKVSKTQAIAAFKSINADAQQIVNGKLLAPPKELDYGRYQKCLKRIYKMLMSEAEALGEVEEEEDRTESPLAKASGRFLKPQPVQTGPVFKRTHSTVMKRVKGPLVGKSSVLNFLMAGPEGALSEGFGGSPYSPPCNDPTAFSS